MLARVGGKLRSFWPVQMLKIIILAFIPYNIMYGFRFNRFAVFLRLQSMFWSWHYPGFPILVSLNSVNPWTAIANLLVVAGPSLYFCHRLRVMSAEESPSRLAAATMVVSLICLVLVSYSYWFVPGGWAYDSVYWQSLQGFVTVLLVLFVFIPTLQRVSSKRLPKKPIRSNGHIRDRLSLRIAGFAPRHVSKLMSLAALILPYGVGLFVDTYVSILSFSSPLVGNASVFYEIVYLARTMDKPVYIGLFFQLGSMAAGFIMLSVLGLQVLFAHEILRYLEDRVTQKRVALVGLILLVSLVLIGILNGVGVNLGLTNNAFIPLPVSIFVGLWLAKKKDQLLLEGEMDPIRPELPTLHEQEISIPIIYVLESRLKKRFRRYKS
ncbi:MAG: hypothetical protein KAW94_05010 [Candidatus Thorarchaeota archaeon]|nr:hypothetical protein [Candidatus Thorarchaeota archaeon]